MVAPPKDNAAALLAVVPAAVTPETSLEVLGLPGKRFRQLLRDHRIAHLKQGKTVIARVEDVLAAITKNAVVMSAADPNTVAGVLAELGLRRSGGAKR